jgi:hypothetical protein
VCSIGIGGIIDPVHRRGIDHDDRHATHDDKSPDTIHR